MAPAGGVSTSIDLGLHLVERLAGRDARATIARQMDYPYTPQGVTLGPDGSSTFTPGSGRTRVTTSAPPDRVAQEIVRRIVAAAT